MIEITDALGRTLQFHTPPKRIVSLVPSITETLFDIGLWERVVGLTRYCVHPSFATTSLPVVGGTKNINIENLIATNPDLVLCNQEENSPEIIRSLEERGLKTYVAFPKDIPDALSDIRTFGSLSNTPDKAQQIIQTIADSLKYCPTKPFTYLYLIWRKPWMISGQDTFIQQMLGAIGGVNLASPVGDRYQEISDEQLRQSNADAILLSSEPFPFQEKHIAQLVALGIEESKIQFINGEYCSWHGTRIAKGIPYLSQWRSQQAF